MGLDLAPLFANLFFYYYENKWINIIETTGVARSRRFVNIFKFIDELTAVNDCGEFEKTFNEIYPTESELKNKHFG